MITKKYYIDFAKILKFSNDLDLKEKFINYLKADNPNFNEQKFREAVA